ncbi:hypothetical protein DR864_22285 [Runella rosea]|uniref:MAE-28990/MAE-18760-like HEPN domain-containing protein n=1 Tax=Runella rosea TaxID=2259595 RepID=A0A344TNR2_9BACT|nr:MAE_28990/MAE_18760 family HEPN-like nuclease [Runella rosea]AXE20283.1 hypothetical protein DR864_22285 [Runella rosea]
MMFVDITNESAKRIVEIREHIDFISIHIPKPPITTPRYLNTAKGLIYVQLYGVIEYTIYSTIAKCIYYINQSNCRIDDLQSVILSLALNSQLEALIQVKSKKWDKRFELFSAIHKNISVNIDTDLIPTDGKNITDKQLKTIWETFNLRTPLFHDVSFRGRLQDIVSNRINIAHGNLPASDIGSNVTIDDLRKRLSDVSGFCTYFINSFEEYIQNNNFRK